jgi:predicted nucleic acid-binding protein
MENYGKNWNDIKTFLSSLLGYKGINIHFTTLLDRITATNFMKDFGVDFDDALILQAMKKKGIVNIISYDKDFDMVSDIKRVLPENLL